MHFVLLIEIKSYILDKNSVPPIRQEPIDLFIKH